MHLDLDALLAVTGTLDLVCLDLSAAVVPTSCVVADPAVVAAVERMRAAVTAARSARLADLADLHAGLRAVRTRWIAAEHAVTAVP